MSQLSIYDKTQGEILRDMGLESVELHNEDFVRSARNIARKLAEMNGQVTMDDVREVFDKLAIAPRHCNSFGAVFKSKEFCCIGRTKSRLTSNHAREIKIWKLAATPTCPRCHGPVSRQTHRRETRLCCAGCGTAGPWATSATVAERLFTKRTRLTGWKTGEYRRYDFKEATP